MAMHSPQSPNKKTLIAHSHRRKGHGRLLCLAFAMLAACMLSACGQKGKLYLPKETESQSQTP